MGSFQGCVEGLHMGKRLTLAFMEEMDFFKINDDDDDERIDGGCLRVPRIPWPLDWSLEKWIPGLYKVCNLQNLKLFS